MSHVSCLVQIGGAADGQEAQLEQRLQAHHQHHYPDDDLSISWRHVAPEMMFTAGGPSRSSVVSCTLPGPTARDARELYMRSICDLWHDATGADPHDLLVSISETNPKTE